MTEKQLKRNQSVKRHCEFFNISGTSKKSYTEYLNRHQLKDTKGRFKSRGVNNG